MIPMAIVLQVVWIVFLIIWMMTGLPYGPGVNTALPPGIL
jgi:aminobenzoyl-glutamate transport protein